MSEYEIIDINKTKPGSLPYGLQRFCQDADKYSRDTHLATENFKTFSILVQMGFQNITYESQFRPQDGAFFWINHQHAKQIGKLLRSTIKYLVIKLTTEEENSFSIMADHLGKGVTIEELAISHITADEVTMAEATGLAKLITKLQVKSFTLWAAEYVEGALETFYEKLVGLKNSFLEDVFIGDASKPDGEDRIFFKPLDDLVQRNKMGRV